MTMSRPGGGLGAGGEDREHLERRPAWTALGEEQWCRPGGVGAPDGDGDLDGGPLGVGVSFRNGDVSALESVVLRKDGDRSQFQPFVWAGGGTEGADL
jgi:hypothetical protein